MFWELESFHLLFWCVYFLLVELRRQELFILQKITHLILFFIGILLRKRNILRVSYFELFLANCLSLFYYLYIRTKITVVREITLRQRRLVCEVSTRTIIWWIVCWCYICLWCRLRLTAREISYELLKPFILIFIFFKFSFEPSDFHIFLVKTSWAVCFRRSIRLWIYLFWMNTLYFRLLSILLHYYLSRRKGYLLRKGVKSLYCGREFPFSERGHFKLICSFVFLLKMKQNPCIWTTKTESSVIEQRIAQILHD